MVRTTRSLRTVRSLALCLLPLAAAGPPARAQSDTPERQRTVEFYVQHPDMRDRVNRSCLNDPGHLQANPDCLNADRANLEAAARETHQMAGDTSDPRTPAYWDKRPNERKFTIAMCSHMTPDHARADTACAPAAASFLAEHPAHNR